MLISTRFNSKLVRCLASFSYVIRSLLNLAVTVFTPCVALKAVIGLPYWASIIGITSISVVFSVMVRTTSNGNTREERAELPRAPVL